MAQPIFFAREDTRTPFRFALVAMVVNAVVAVGLGFVIGFLGAAIATSVAAWVMVALLARGRGAMGEVATFDTRFRTRIWRIIAASVAMGAVLWGLTLILSPFLGLEGWRYVALATLVGLGVVSYFAFGRAFGAFSMSDLKGAVRRSAE